MRRFKIENVNCQNCVNLIKNSLEDEFGNFEFEEGLKTVRLDLDDDKIVLLREQLQELGFKLLEEI
ncbi:heavy-metal-associated domain-containing protein [Campylobacter sp. US33a]|uniref:heavy-metal-associated domain-containing protein n=1 Tax=Campylobacter sp. US33a TaxID=2498120 RepID=UPI00106748E9|nr:heavy-metal-associated domain-containing protein [Campylobacter sp. US33a]MCW1360120.1 heavy-metal-associated domain-containing protein [Campylobacter jejuni]TEY03478.1 copper chaperone [Campylobacter sp. US33a]